MATSYPLLGHTELMLPTKNVPLQAVSHQLVFGFLHSDELGVHPVLELLDVIDASKQGGLLAHLNQKEKTLQSKQIRAQELKLEYA
ncbi:hypothetical protein C2845_PM04G22140 [Panicum miliaceum]|uniref:Uncharacterized protein n=1 Tax=Panicum miliaceum TaxID=4540 RepID=A0A3L6QL85_PANMI|nr:hypothetical protein C2845_PM04G22140 [Panicum miliaceum]